MTASTIVFANNKGGTAKTTSTANLMVALTSDGFRVLGIDADPQGHLTQLFGARDAPGTRLEDVIVVGDLSKAPSVVTERADPQTKEQIPLAGGVHLIPCSGDLAEVALGVARAEDAELRLRNAVALLREHYDYILIDAPPGTQPMSALAIIAADYLVIPTRPADLDMDGSEELYELVDGGSYADFNPNLRVLGLLVTQEGAKWKLAKETVLTAESADMRVIPQHIPFAVGVGRAPRFSMPTVLLEPDTRVALAYRRVAKWLTEEVAIHA
ncbi:MAG: ParA family protein [Solirubrobacterales bacterium]|nr:ParA family protein [Solirubrobacterales bacterium]